MRRLSFWVYENWTAEHKAVVHAGTCGNCNDGVGCHENRRGNRNGRWLGTRCDLSEVRSGSNIANFLAAELRRAHETGIGVAPVC